MVDKYSYKTWVAVLAYRILEYKTSYTCCNTRSTLCYCELFTRRIRIFPTTRTWRTHCVIIVLLCYIINNGTCSERYTTYVYAAGGTYTCNGYYVL